MIGIQHFYLNRIEDVSGKSGTGVVAVGAILPSGICVLEWQTFYSSICYYKNIETVREIHGHEGRTEVLLGDPVVTKPKKVRKKRNSSEKA